MRAEGVDVGGETNADSCGFPAAVGLMGVIKICQQPGGDAGGGEGHTTNNAT